jgi:hypothetical protein
MSDVQKALSSLPKRPDESANPSSQIPEKTFGINLVDFTLRMSAYNKKIDMFPPESVVSGRWKIIGSIV